MMDHASDDSADEPGRPFEITAVAIGTYEKYAAIPADAEAAKVVAMLAQLGASEVRKATASNPGTQQAVNGLLADWSESASANAMLFWVGHGEASPDEAWLAVHETRRPMSGTGISPANLAAHISNHWLRRQSSDNWAVIVVEACGAERFVALLASALTARSGGPKRLLLLGAGGTGQNFLGQFSGALETALASFTDNDREIRLYDLMERARGRLTEGLLLPLDLFPQPVFRRKQILPGGVTATVDTYAELQAFLRELPGDERHHFVPKAQGAEQGELAWYFTGRVNERRQISAWLREATSGMLLVTGRAGSGKSALLGHILVYANKELRELLVRHGLIPDIGEQERPPDGAFTDVVHLTGLSTADVVSRLLTKLRSELVGTSLSESVEHLVGLLRKRPEPFTLLADALDESQEPASIAASVLRRIAAQPGCRVVVGSRRSTKEGPDLPDTVDEDLVQALGAGDSLCAIQVERDLDALAEYVRRRLQAAVRLRQLPAETRVEEIARLVADQRGRQFLYARLAVHEILARPSLGVPENQPELRELLANDHRGLFAQAVSRLASSSPMDLALLEALSLAQGRGLPRADRIWAIVAGSGFFEQPVNVTEQDVDRVLQSAAPYILLDAEDGQSVYRLAHRTFQEHFVSVRKARFSEEAVRSQNQRITAALLADAKAKSSGELNGYVRRHLAGHVAAASMWRQLAEAPEVLDCLDPDSVSHAVLAHAFGRADEPVPPEVAAVVSVRHALRRVSPEHRSLTRMVAMVRLGRFAVRPTAQGGSSVLGRAYVRWSTLKRTPPHVTLTDEHYVSSMVSFALPDGRTVLAVGNDDGSIQLWDAGTATKMGSELRGHRGGVTALAVLALGGGPLIASGSGDNTVRLWNPVTGAAVGGPLKGHTDRVTSITGLAWSDGCCFLFSCAADATIWRWRIDENYLPHDFAVSGMPISFRDDFKVASLATVPWPDGRKLIAAGGWQQNIRLLDPDSGDVACLLSSDHKYYVTSMVTLTLADGRNVLAASADGRVRIWDLGPGPLIREPVKILEGEHLSEYAMHVYSLAVVRTGDGHPVLAAAESTRISYQDPVPGRVSDALLGFHADDTNLVATVMLADGRYALASSGWGRTLKLWDTSAAMSTTYGSDSTAGFVMSLVAFKQGEGKWLVASAGSDEANDADRNGIVRVWGASDGAALGMRFTTTRSTYVAQVTAVRFPNGATVLASLAAGSVHLSDSNTGASVAACSLDDVLSGIDTQLVALTLPGGRPLLAVNLGSIHILDAATPTLRRVKRIFRKALSLQAIQLQDGRNLLAWGAERSKVVLWDPASRSIVGKVFTCQASRVTKLAAITLPDGRCLLAAANSDWTIRVMQIHDGSTLTLPSHGFGERVLIAAVSRWGWSAREWLSRICKAPGGLLTGHRRGIHAMAFLQLSDGTCLLASGGEDMTVRLWDLQEPRCVRVWEMGFEVFALAWAGDRLVVGGRDGLVAIAF